MWGKLYLVVLDERQSLAGVVKGDGLGLVVGGFRGVVVREVLLKEQLSPGVDTGIVVAGIDPSSVEFLLSLSQLVYHDIFLVIESVFSLEKPWDSFRFLSIDRLLVGIWRVLRKIWDCNLMIVYRSKLATVMIVSWIGSPLDWRCHSFRLICCTGIQIIVFQVDKMRRIQEGNTRLSLIVDDKLVIDDGLIVGKVWKGW